MSQKSNYYFLSVSFILLIIMLFSIDIEPLYYYCIGILYFGVSFMFLYKTKIENWAKGIFLGSNLLLLFSLCIYEFELFESWVFICLFLLSILLLIYLYMYSVIYFYEQYANKNYNQVRVFVLYFLGIQNLFTLFIVIFLITQRVETEKQKAIGFANVNELNIKYIELNHQYEKIKGDYYLLDVELDETKEKLRIAEERIHELED